MKYFAALFLNAQNGLIASEELFRGSLTQTSVYPREILKRALHHNAAGSYFRAQPSIRRGRTKQRRPDSHPDLEKRAERS